MSIALYYTSNRHTSNTLTEFDLNEVNSSDALLSGYIYDLGYTAVIKATIDVVHSDGSTTNIATDIANRTYGTGSPFDDTWDCPGFSMVPTDAIRITEKIYFDGVEGTTPYPVGTNPPNSHEKPIWISDQLGWNYVNPSTWTFHRHMGAAIGGPPENRWIVVFLQHNDSTYDCNIGGIDYRTSVIKSFNGVLYANLKKVNGVAIANVKKLMGVA